MLSNICIALAGVGLLAWVAMPMASEATTRPFVAFPTARVQPRPYPQVMLPRVAPRTPMRTRAGTVYSPYPCSTAIANAATFDGMPSSQDNSVDFEGSAVVGGFANQACDANSGVVSGSYNIVGEDGDAYASVIAGGSHNALTGAESFLGAGGYNTNQGNGSFLGSGGFENTGNEVSGNDAFLGSGDKNSLDGSYGFLGGGFQNTVQYGADEAVLAGGNYNLVTSDYGTIGGGSGNKVEGAFAVIPGGADDEAFGAASFAAGYHADAAHNGSFVWSDDSSGSSIVSDTNVDQFVVRATGGTFIYSSETLASGVKLASGSGTWASLSDRTSKTDLASIDDASVLAKVAALPIGTWRYKTESGVRHVGPMAQDFYAAFGVGEDNRHITSIDEDGVALAAIKGLSTKLDRKDAEIAKLERKSAEVDELRAHVRRLDAAIAKLLQRR